jgi:antitoxin component YwqK of YwqJK toxin-antitoxin module
LRELVDASGNEFSINSGGWISKLDARGNKSMKKCVIFGTTYIYRKINDIIYKFDESGNIKCTTICINNIRHGEHKRYRMDMSVSYVTDYCNGKKCRRSA